MEKNELQHIERLRKARERVVSELKKVIVNQERVIEELLIALFANGHCLVVGVPGLAKTLLVSSLAKVLDLKYTRIQFTPDLMPSDITGTEILHEEPATKSRVFKFVKGPVFSNIILADEINRTPPKTQAALLQAMQEYEVTAGGETYKLDLPFFVLATQNPIELECSSTTPRRLTRGPLSLPPPESLPPFFCRYSRLRKSLNSRGLCAACQSAITWSTMLCGWQEPRDPAKTVRLIS
jgi:MoxR-like ATPase